MQEWLNWPAWKASKPQKGFGGSNPPLSAEFYAGVSNEFLDTPFLLKVSLYLFARYLRCRGTLLSLEWQRPRGRILRIERS